jgi:ATP-dependent DNA helicase RecQ
VRQLIHRGYLVQDIAHYSVLRLTSSAGAVLKGDETVELARPRIREKKPAKKSTVAAELREVDQDLFERLRELRRNLAQDAGVPPYVLFGDATLLEMSRERPGNEEEFLAITGVGKVKLERYGEVFLEAISRQAAG